MLFGTFDAPAKCLFQHFCQFNGYYGCPYCLNPGESVQTSVNGHTLTYPFNEGNLETGHGPKRNHKETLNFASIATKETAAQGKEVNEKGVKGFSWFMFIPNFDIIRGCGIDYMHATLLGVVKMLLQLWLTASYSKEPWSVSKKLKEINCRYMNIMPPSSITRLPRSLIQHLNHLKASELRTFLLFYSIPCLYGILPDLYFQHYILLVEAIYLLLQDSITPSQIKKANSLLKHFCLKLGVLYGPRYRTFNAHCLLHLTDRVCDLGPLWTHSCFCYEDFNGELRRLFHGTQSVEEQLVLAVSIQQKLPELTPLLADGTLAKDLYDKLDNHNIQAKNDKMETITDGLFFLGSYKAGDVLSVQENIIIESLIGKLARVKVFHKILMKKEIVHCEDYKRMKKRNNHTVEYRSHDSIAYGQIKKFLKCHPVCPNPFFCNDSCVCKTSHCLAVIYHFDKDNNIILEDDKHTGAKLNHLVPVAKEKRLLKVIKIHQIVRLCIYIDCKNSDTAFIGLFPNHYEKD